MAFLTVLWNTENVRAVVATVWFEVLAGFHFFYAYILEFRKQKNVNMNVGTTAPSHPGPEEKA